MKKVLLKAEDWFTLATFIGQLKAEVTDEARKNVKSVDEIDTINKEFLSVRKALSDKKDADGLVEIKKYRKAVYENPERKEELDKLVNLATSYINVDKYEEEDAHLKTFAEKEIMGELDEGTLTWVKGKMESEGAKMFNDKKLFITLLDALTDAPDASKETKPTE